MTVYLDVIWLLNFLFDSLLLYLTATILKRKILLWRVFAGGFVGSLIILLTITPLNTFTGHPISKLCFSIVMILITFGYKRMRYFLTCLMTLYLFTFLIGGALIGVHYFLKFDMKLSSSVMLSSIKGFGDPISWLFVLLGFPIAWHFSKQRLENIEMTKIQFDQLVNVTIFIHECSYQFIGLVDSGNQLYDPLTKIPVMVASLKGERNELPKSIYQIAENPESILTGTMEIPSELENKLRFIPCKVVGQEHQIIVAVKPDHMIIEKDEETLIVKKSLVSFTMQELSADDRFQCIVHPKMLTGFKAGQQKGKVG
ncbi:sigma-E processing peptidase SpoIIGA [Bacillus aquiflavi]|uniref:Sigma-E processing peptidase SpoIIGA n=1 Tax=Bacillus aquiflavi TaxID=2672567 RepID=A0A6B3VX56_9BACI|nr:sigma-E processing peptidase SpoIIGA [Bacillus aquiflavi]MBA4537601.1 sigma-E processing peptidase SpoIIGA [Bacillus aquiflavi]NEY81858.1 sigma-E processing peptidase SpoIIGA [Bacillus aquiflavi]